MEGYCLTGQSPQRAIVPMEEEEKEVVDTMLKISIVKILRSQIEK
jgi:hypothetical protein